MNPETTSAPTRRKRIVLVTACALLLLVVLRIINIRTQSPEYDELWTMLHYVNVPVSKIFSDVATPNNHVLNSLCIKFFVSWIPDPVLAMRLPALLAFIALAAMLLCAVRSLLREDAARGAVLALVLLDGMVLHYAETARGYSLQTFFLFGVFYSLSRFSSAEGRRRLGYALLWLVCAAGSCLAVSSGVVSVTVLTVLWGLLHVQFRSGLAKLWRDHRPLIWAGACWAVFVLAWYGGNYAQFAQGRANFGEVFTSAGRFLEYCWDILRTTGLFWPLAILIAGLVRFRKETAARAFLWVAGSVVLMLVSALFTKGGPPRVYVPLVPVAIFGAGMVLDEFLTRYEKLKKYGMVIFLFLLIAAACCSESRRLDAADPDMGVIFSQVRKLEPHILPVYRPTDLYVIVNLFGRDAKADNVNRLTAPSMILLVHDNVIGTMRFADSSTSALVPDCPAVTHSEIARNAPGWLYRLRPVAAGENLDGKVVLCIMHGSEPELLSPDPDSWLK